MKPHYSFDLTTILRSIIDNWDVSVEQLPIHFARVHGKDAVLRELSMMGKEYLPEGSLLHRKIGTMRWWLTGL
jgi:hypothetical protein